jgi:hypothetical protein
MQTLTLRFTNKENAAATLTVATIFCLLFSSLPLTVQAQNFGSQNLPLAPLMQNPPSPPTFTVKIVPHIYNSSSITTDTPVASGYYYKWRTLEICVQNSPYHENPTVKWYLSVDPQIVHFNVRVKPHLSNQWIELYGPQKGYPEISLSNTTTITVGTAYSTSLQIDSMATPFNASGEVDFQMQAMVGEVRQAKGTLGYVFEGQKGDWSATQTLLIDLVPPKIVVQSPQSRVYSSTEDLPLQFTVNETVTKMACSFDGEKEIILSENTTLTNLSNGAHNLTVYAWDASGNMGASETVDFTVTTSPIAPGHQNGVLEGTNLLTLVVYVVGVVGVLAIVIGIVRYIRQKNPCP